MKTPKISVVMPVYNTPEEYLRPAIESILNQTYTDFEFIIIDDGSKNNVSDTIKSYQDKRIIFIQNKSNLGIFKTRNKMCSMAKGAYIAVMDSDDISLPNRFEKQVLFLDTHPDITVLGSWVEFFPEKNIWKTLPYPKMLDFVFGAQMPHPSVMYRRSDFEKNDITYDANLPCAGDYDLWSKVAMSGLKFANIQEVLLKYRWHSANISHTKKQLQNQIAAQVSKRVLSALTEDITTQQEIFKMRSTGIKNINKKVYLFYIIPFLYIKKKFNKTKISLFGIIPFLKIKSGRK